MTSSFRLVVLSTALLCLIAEAGAPTESLRPVRRGSEVEKTAKAMMDARTAKNTSYPPATNPRTVTLPECINNETPGSFGPEGLKALDFIEHEFDNNKGGNRYKGYTSVYDALHIDSVEQFTRLVYAETMAMGPDCLDSATMISGAENIAGVIYNRIKRKNGDIKKAIWENSQFASSIHQYENLYGGKSHFRDMLCPENQQAWNLANHFVNGLLSGKLQNTLPERATNYYFCKHFDLSKMPEKTRIAWGLNDSPDDCDPWSYTLVRKNINGVSFSEKYNKCMTVYKDGWW